MSSFNKTKFSSSNNLNPRPKFTYKKRNPKDNNIEEEGMLKANRLRDINKASDNTANINHNSVNTVTSSDLQSPQEQNQGVISSSFIIGHIISGNELALASSYRKLNDVFDEFSELQRQNNKASGKSGLKKSEKISDVKKNNQNRSTKNNERGNGRKRGGIGGNGKQKEISKRALKSKSNINERVQMGTGKKVIIEKDVGTSPDKNNIQQSVLKKNNNSGKVDKKFEDTADKTNNEERNYIVNQEDADDIDFGRYINSSEVEDWHDMHPILTSTPDSTFVLHANSIDSKESTGDESHNNSNEEEDILPDFFPVYHKNGGPKEKVSTYQNDQFQKSLFNNKSISREVLKASDTEKNYSSQDTNIVIPLQTRPQKYEGRRFVLKPLANDDDELEAFNKPEITRKT